MFNYFILILTLITIFILFPVLFFYINQEGSIKQYFSLYREYIFFGSSILIFFSFIMVGIFYKTKSGNTNSDRVIISRFGIVTEMIFVLIIGLNILIY